MRQHIMLDDTHTWMSSLQQDLLLPVFYLSRQSIIWLLEIAETHRQMPMVQCPLLRLTADLASCLLKVVPGICVFQLDGLNSA